MSSGGTGPPTKDEMVRLYPPQYTWEQLKDFISSGDLSLLKRHPELEKRCDAWYTDIRASHGSVVNYLMTDRLCWSDLSNNLDVNPPYFTPDIEPQYFKILTNDWPYSVPNEIMHYLIWSRLPFIHKDLINSSIWDRVEHDGLWGFTGGESRPIAATSINEQNHLNRAGSQIHQFVLQQWPEEVWETAWFLNPTRIQSVREVAHVHVFARRKDGH